MTHIPQIHQLVVRRRRDEQVLYPEGDDEFIGQTPTGKIVLGYRVVDGVVVYDYAPMTVDEAADLAEAGLFPFPDDYVQPPLELAVEAHIAATMPNTETRAAMEEARTIAHAREGVMTERYVISFSWHYGDEEVVVTKLEDAEPTRKGIESKYRSFTFSNWKVRKEVVFTSEVDMWAEEPIEKPQ